MKVRLTTLTSSFSAVWGEGLAAGCCSESPAVLGGSGLKECVWANDCITILYIVRRAVCVEVVRSSIFNVVLGVKPKAWPARALPPEPFSHPRNSFSLELRVSTKEGEIHKAGSLIKGQRISDLRTRSVRVGGEWSEGRQSEHRLKGV